MIAYKSHDLYEFVLLTLDVEINELVERKAMLLNKQIY